MKTFSQRVKLEILKKVYSRMVKNYEKIVSKNEAKEAEQKLATI